MKIRNIILVLIIIVAIRSCTGCCGDPMEIPFDFLKIETIAAETMYSEEVFFKVDISDTAHLYYGSNCKNYGFGYTSAYALSCEDAIYISNQQVTEIQIETLFPISSEITAGSNVSHLFYSRDFLYYPLQELVSKGLNKRVYTNPKSSFTIFLKEKVENSVAQFVIMLEFSDGSSLTDTTSVITIIPN